MFDELKEKLIGILTSRLTVFSVIFCLLGGILIWRCFNLQIVHGEEYLEDFTLEIEKTRDILSTRGNIYDRNGNVLAYNELAYSVKIEDVFESGRSKNAKLNDTVLNLIHLIEKNGDNCITDFKIVLDEDGEFAFTVEGNALLRFLADVYGHKSTGDLKDEQRTATAREVMEYLSRSGGFAVGEYQDPEDTDSEFLPGEGYTREEWLKMITIRYAMNLTSYRKYIGTIVATNVNEKTVAVILENSDILPGVTIVEDTVRRYVDSVYFAHVVGYTGKISSEEMADLNTRLAGEGKEEETYSINDVVGKGGIESSFETTLQGQKGYEKVIVDNTGKVISIVERREAKAGQDIYLTIDKDLTIFTYKAVEKKLAEVISANIINAKEYRASANATSSDVKIPIYDVYYSMFNNSVIDMKHLAEESAAETEKAVYRAYLDYKQSVYDRITLELQDRLTPYNKLAKEYQVYQSNIVTLLKRNGVIMEEMVDPADATQIAWAEKETISLGEYLKYCIAQNWVDVKKLDLDGKYSDSTEIYGKISEYIISMIDKNTEFQKKFYKYMLLGDVITGRQVCQILCEQDKIPISENDREAIFNGRLSAYQFMKNRIDTLQVTPAQMALDPCNASVVVTDVNTGDVLALVSYPGYDTNKMANSVDAEYFAKLNADKSTPQLNYATQYSGAPGSTYKMVSATAGLVEGVVHTSTKIFCTGTFTEITPSPRCSRRSGHGYETGVTAIRDSCNIYFYTIGYQMSMKNGSYNEAQGLAKLREYADWYGLTDKSGVEISEASPTVSTEYPVPSAIGQGNNSFTTVGIARYVATVANGGTCYNLTLLDKITDSEGNIIQEKEPDVRNVIDMPTEYWNVIHQGMRLMIQEGKAYFSELPVTVAGKTGTAQQTESRPPHAVFVGYAPYEAPEVAIAVRIPFGYAADHSSRIGWEVFNYYFGPGEASPAEEASGETVSAEE